MASRQMGKVRMGTGDKRLEEELGEGCYISRPSRPDATLAQTAWTAVGVRMVAGIYERTVLVESL